MAESEDRYRILLECASDGIVSLNRRGIIIEFNKKQKRSTTIQKTRSLARASP